MDSTNQDLLLGEAAQWCARLAAHDCTDLERRRCSKWRCTSPAHAAAFARMCLIAERTKAAAELDLRLQQLAEQAFAAGDSIAEDAEEFLSTPIAEPTAHRHFLYWRGLAAAAGIAAVALISWSWIATESAHRANSAIAVVYEAPSHSARHETLEDGTQIYIDAGGKVAASFTPHARQVELQAGRAYFEVAHDASRPFSVLAAGTRTVALGTKFEVDRRTLATIVTLAEGSVEVSSSEQGSHWTQRLQPNEQIDITVSRPTGVRKVDAEEVVGWSRGWLEFHGTPLQAVLQEINRYSVRQIVAADDSLLGLQVAGRFVAGDTQSVAAAIAEVLPIRVVDGGNREIILFKRYDE